MVMMEICEDEKEKSLHDSAIQRLAEELRRPLKEIDALYEGALREMKRTARVKDYLIILASRHVKDHLQRPGRAA